MIRDSIIKNRSYRRFYEEVPIELETLRELVDLARLWIHHPAMRYFLFWLLASLRR